MSDRAEILNKIKLLLNLTKSSEENEAATAQTLADKLIAKYSITPEELESLDDSPLYGEDTKLYSTTQKISWIARLAAAIAEFHNCYAVQEVQTSSTGEVQYVYYLSGDLVDIEAGKLLFAKFFEEINSLTKSKCVFKSDHYKFSFQEGLIDGIKEKLASIDYISKPKEKEEKEALAEVKTTEMVTTADKLAPKKPTENVEKIEYNEGTLIDPAAYYKGVNCGYNIQFNLLSEESYVPPTRTKYDPDLDLKDLNDAFDRIDDYGYDDYYEDDY